MSISNTCRIEQGVNTVNRREFLKSGALMGLLSSPLLVPPSLKAMELLESGKDFSPKNNGERQGIPSVCLQCVSGCGIIGYVEDGRLVKIEGNPEHPNSRGRLCAKGQAGVNQVYDPDRILYPLKRAGKRGEGKWERISWDQALSELVGKMKTLREQGRAQEVVFRSGRNRIGDLTERFFTAYGTPHQLNHTTICEGSKFVANELTWGYYRELPDVDHTKYILNFGSNPFEAHTIHVSLAQRISEARVNQRAKLVTFDVRLSNTAGRSDEWFPIKPGTDGAVALAMTKAIMDAGEYDADFINTWTTSSVEQLKAHLAPYTPEWAEKISGVAAPDIRRLALEFASARPHATTLSYRGVASHSNGTMSERCISLLNAVIGSVDAPGGYGMAEAIKYKEKASKPPALAQKSELVKPHEYPLASHGVAQLGLPLIEEGRAKCSIYVTYVNNDAYSYPDTEHMKQILANETLIPYFVSVDAYMGEATLFADLILPDATYLERQNLEQEDCFSRNPYVALRQPVIPPLGESRPFQDVLIDLAQRIGGGLEKFFDFKTMDEYVAGRIAGIEGLQAAGGLDYLKKHGVWFDPNKKLEYYRYKKPIKSETLNGTIVENGTIYKMEGDKKKYVGVMIKDQALQGFIPTAFPLSGKFEIYSKILEEKGLPPLPTYVPIEHLENLAQDDLILTTFKVHVQTQSRTANCKWLSEIFHDNPLWIHPQSAAKRNLKDGDEVIVQSKVGQQKTKVRVTEGIHPLVVAFAMGVGHTEYGRYASGKKVVPTPDDQGQWWHTFGVHLNSLVPVMVDPIGGGQPFMETVVKVSKV
ncbi:dehydrogenase [Desulfosporosinus metallidurans]|uniref:Dehydrogenase n=1 Tax=Desulfosporosinus metallidurans TaxID=1888891 RepID=A0A1Q8R058_9FIRM|nr:dehydrogenase [Desulfosporosinus metallidurans]